ncbi:hypothetical protein MUK42_33059, partial [Musa troglodytarum]
MAAQTCSTSTSVSLQPKGRSFPVSVKRDVGMLAEKWRSSEAVEQQSFSLSLHSTFADATVCGRRYIVLILVRENEKILENFLFFSFNLDPELKILYVRLGQVWEVTSCNKSDDPLLH